MEWSIVSDLSIVFGGSAVLASAIIGSLTLLRIEKHKRRDNQIREVRVRADAHRRLWHVLEQIVADEERERTEEIHTKPSTAPRLIIDKIVDDKWIREYFRDNAALLDTELHDVYQKALRVHPLDRDMLREHEKWKEDPDIRNMIDIAQKKTEEYDRRCRDIDGSNPLN